MAFVDVGQARWETCIAEDTGDGAISSTTAENLVVTISAAAKGAKYKTVEIPHPADAAGAREVNIYGVTAGKADDNGFMDPYTLTESKFIRIKTSKLLRARAVAPYADAQKNGRVVCANAADKLGQVRVTTVAGEGQGKVVGGETINGIDYVDFYLDESATLD